MDAFFSSPSPAAASELPCTQAPPRSSTSVGRARENTESEVHKRAIDEMEASSTPLMAPLAKRARKPEDLVLHIFDHQLLFQAMQIAASISIAEDIQLYVKPVGDVYCLEFYGVANDTACCYKGKWLVTAASLPPLAAPTAENPNPRYGPYNLKGNLLLSALQNKSPRGDDTFLKLTICTLKDAVVLEYGSTQERPDRLSIRETVRLVQETEQKVEMEMEHLVYHHKVKFLVDDLRGVFKCLHDNKYVEFTFTVYADSENPGVFAIRIAAKTVLRGSKYTFLHQANSSDPADPTVSIGTGELEAMKPIFQRVFHVQRFYQIIRHMKEHYINLHFDNESPLCLRYQLASAHPEVHSCIDCYICPMNSEDDIDETADIPVPDDPRSLDDE